MWLASNVEKLPWWAILIIVLSILIIVIVVLPIIRFFNNKKNQNLESKVQKKQEQSLPNHELKKDPKNTPYLGIYNYFGKKQALRITKTVYVNEVEDPCPLCIHFENKVLSLEEYGQNITLMSEAISKGYHHVGCKHIDIDYFHGTTIIPDNKWTKEHKQTRYTLRLKQYQLEQEIRDLKYKIENQNNSNQQEEKMLLELTKKQNSLQRFCDRNDLIRNQKRENPYLSDIEKFS